MINVNKVYIQYGPRVVLNQVSCSIHERDKIGLVGLNGAGKSTLLKAIAGEISPHEGSIDRPNNSSLGFLHQDMDIPKGKTVIEETITAFEEQRHLQQRIAEVNEALAERSDYESDGYMQLINDLSTLNDRFTFLGGHSMEADAERVLKGLGFQQGDFNRLTDTFSGGWQMRIELAKMLLQRPDYLLLDEPTNHLDIESILWLERFLKDYPGCVLLISHDRTFLDKVTSRTIEIELGRLYDYKAPYSEYLELRKERREQMRSAYENQQKEIADKERLIDRFRAKANKAKMAQSLIKQLDKMERIELEEENKAEMRLSFPPAPRAGRIVLEAHQVRKAFGEKLVLKDVDFKLERAERVAFVGKNGEGKSTFSKILIGHLGAEGEVQKGHNVSIGYYAQNQSERLDPNLTVLETIEAESPAALRPKLRSILGSFLFSGEAVEKKVSVLSGGERARLALACLLLHPVNLLVLDEPTNHLDMRSKNVLKEALKAYDGALIVVSHDRDFLEELTEKTIEFNQKQLKTYLGDIRYFLEKREVDNFRDVSLGKKSGEEKAPNTPRPVKKSLSKEEQKEERRLQRSVKNAENKVTRLEESIAKAEREMGAEGVFGTEKYQRLLEKYEAEQAALEEAMETWESLMMEYEEKFE